MGDPVSKRINVRDFLEKIFDGRERTTKERELCRFSGPRQIWIKALIEFTDVSLNLLAFLTNATICLAMRITIYYVIDTE